MFGNSSNKEVALSCASTLLANSTEANAKKRAAQAIYIAEMLMKWLDKGVIPEYQGNLDLIYHVSNKERFK